MNDKLWTDFSVLLTWSGLSQALAFIGTLVVAGFVGPDAFGVLAEFISIAIIIGSFVSLRVEWHIPNIKGVGAQGRFVFGAILSSLLIGALSVVFVCLAKSSLLQGGADLHISVMLVLYCYVVIISCEGILLAILIANNEIARSAKPKAVRPIVFIIISGFLYWLGVDDNVLIYSTTIAAGMYIFFLLREVKYLILEMYQYRTKASPLNELKRYGYSKIITSVVISVLNSASYNMLPIFLVHSYGLEIAGLVFLAQRIIMAPTSLISSSLGGSFWAYASNHVEQNTCRLKERYLSSTKSVAKFSIAIILFSIALFTLSSMVDLKAWSRVPSLVLALTPMAIGVLVFSSFGHLIVLGKHKYQLVPDLLRIIFVIIAVYYCALNGVDILYCILCVSIIYFLSHVAFFLTHLAAYQQLRCPNE